jgi:hypothetical protein
MSNKVVKVVAIIFLGLVAMTAIVVLATFLSGLAGG